MPPTTHDLAKYPFLPQAQNYIKQLNLTIQELTETPQIIKHAQQRITQSFQTIPQPSPRIQNLHIEITSFPVAIMMVAAIDDNYLKKRYALYEAKKAYQHLKQEKAEKILEIAKFFNWNVQTAPEISTYPFAINFVNYLQNTTTLQHSEWKLINRQLEKGRVYITIHEATRLLQEEIRKHIETKLDTKITQLPPEIQKTIQKLKNTFISQKTTIKKEEYPQTVDLEAFPPCIKALYEATTTGHHLSHTGRFTLTAFLINIGMPAQSIMDLYHNLTDFNERLTLYQIEHIAGQRGSRTKYKPPKCQTLRTHGICTQPDEDCQKAGTTLRCYKTKLKQKTK
ncbi:MAG: hypothetical protein ACLFU9_07060 [Candidatus Bathyarchaeia archaeon]